MANRSLIGLASSLLVGACSVVGIRSGTPEPHYTVIDKIGVIEIRHYDARAAAETDVADDEVGARYDGFRRLADYIFGANGGGRKIEMTAPVAQSPQATTDTGAPGERIEMTAPVSQAQASGGQWTIRFFLPPGMTAETAPRPSNAAVRVVTVPPEDVAVLRFSGTTGAAAVAEERSKLLAGLAGSSWKTDDAPFAWFYDPPWTLPPFRRNEVGIKVRQ